MPPKEIFIIGEKDQQVAEFLEQLRAAGHLRVRLGENIYSLSMSRETVSQKGRDFLTKGGPVDR